MSQSLNGSRWKMITGQDNGWTIQFLFNVWWKEKIHRFGKISYILIAIIDYYCIDVKFQGHHDVTTVM